MYNFLIALTTVSLVISSSLAVEVNFGFNDNVLACDGDSVKVMWQGFHNIQETAGSGCNSGNLGFQIEGFLGAGEERTYSNDELTASPGERRYFSCSIHCGPTNNRFEVYCPKTSPAPTGDSTSCMDSTVPMYYRNDFLTCAQVDANLCEKAKIKSHCPLTCDACEEYECENSMAPMKIDGNSISCERIARIAIKKPDRIASECADSDDLYTTCRDTCGFCSN